MLRCSFASPPQDLYNYLSLLIWFATLFMQDASL